MPLVDGMYLTCDLVNDKNNPFKHLKFDVEDLVCPISKEIFDDPVSASDGIIYERLEIEKWMKRSKISPIKRTEFSHEKLSQCHLITKYLSQFNDCLASIEEIEKGIDTFNSVDQFNENLYYTYISLKKHYKRLCILSLEKSKFYFGQYICSVVQTPESFWEQLCFELISSDNLLAFIALEKQFPQDILLWRSKFESCEELNILCFVVLKGKPSCFDYIIEKYSNLAKSKFTITTWEEYTNDEFTLFDYYLNFPSKFPSNALHLVKDNIITKDTLLNCVTTAGVTSSMTVKFEWNLEEDISPITYFAKSKRTELAKYIVLNFYDETKVLVKNSTIELYTFAYKQKSKLDSLGHVLVTLLDSVYKNESKEVVETLIKTMKLVEDKHTYANIHYFLRNWIQSHSDINVVEEEESEQNATAYPTSGCSVLNGALYPTNGCSVINSTTTIPHYYTAFMSPLTIGTNMSPCITNQTLVVGNPYVSGAYALSGSISIPTFTATGFTYNN